MSGGLYSQLAAHLAEPAARALLLAIIAGVALFRTKDASIKFLVWKCVLAAALAMPLLGWALPGLPVILHRPAWMAAPAKAETGVASSTQPETKADARPLASAPSSSPRRRESTLDLTKSFLTPRSIAGGSPAPQERSFPWRLAGALVYFLVATLLLARLATGWICGRRLTRSAARVEDPRVLGLLAEQARAFHVQRQPALTTSESVAVPVTMDVFEPVIVLPSKCAEWDERKWRAVLAHELSHVARRDARTFLFSHLHRCLFWFSPLSWWLDRELRALAEQASDDQALEQIQDRIYYAEVLLGFWKDLDGAPMRVRWEGASMTKGIRVNERVERILRAPGTKRIRKPATVAAAILAVPAVYFAAALKPAVAPQEPAPPAPVVAPAPAAAPVPAPAPVKPLAGVYRPGPEPLAPAVAPAEPVPPPAPALAPVPPSEADVPFVMDEDAEQHLITAVAPEYPPLAQVARIQGTVRLQVRIGKDGSVEDVQARSGHPLLVAAAAKAVEQWKFRPFVRDGNPVDVMKGVEIPFKLGSPPHPAEAPGAPSPGDRLFLFHNKGFLFNDEGSDYDEDEGVHYVIVSGDHVSMSGNSDDAHRAKALRSKINGDYIWFHREEKEYVITDAKTVEQAKALFAPEEELGRKQEALGKMQEELGAQQEELAKHMEEVKVKLPDLRKQLKELEERLSDIDTPRTQEQLAELQAQLGEMQARIGEQMARAGGMQGELGAKQGALGAKQGELGRKQGELGREQGRLAREANRKMKSMLEEAIKSGLAQPAPK